MLAHVAEQFAIACLKRQARKRDEMLLICFAFLKVSAIIASAIEVLTRDDSRDAIVFDACLLREKASANRA